MAYFASETIYNNLCVDYHSLIQVGKILEIRRTHRSPTLQDIS